MDDDTKAPNKVLLAAPEDWDTWLLIFKTYAQGKQVWEYVDPDKATELIEPPVPTVPETMTDAVYKKLELEIRLYTIRHSAWKEANRGLQSLLDWIQTTVSQRWLVRLQGKDTVRAKVKGLRDALDTDTVTKKLEAQQQLAKAYAGLSSRLVDKWINNLLDCVEKAERLKVYESDSETHKTAEYIKLFSAIQAIDPGFVYAWQEPLTTPSHPSYEECKKKSVTDVINLFRQHWKKIQAQAKLPSYTKAAFGATFQGSDASGQQGNQEGTRCPLGGHKHPVDKCWVIHTSIRPPSYTVSEAGQSQLVEAMQDPKKKQIIEQSRKRVQGKSVQGKSVRFKDDDASKDTTADEALSGWATGTTTFHVGPVDAYPLRDSFLFDSGTTLHICNNRARFEGYESLPGSQPESVRSGDTTVPILGYGQVRVNCDDGPALVLRKVAYCPTFLTSLVSADRLEEKSIFYDGEMRALKRDGRKVIGLARMFRQRVIEFNTLENDGQAALPVVAQGAPQEHPVGSTASQSTQPPQPPGIESTKSKKTRRSRRKRAGAMLSRQRFDRLTTAEIWHRRFGHLSPKPLQKAIERYTQQKLDVDLPKTRECHDCALAKSHRIISREPPSRPAERPGARIHLDQFEFTSGIGGKQYLATAFDEYSHTIQVYTYGDKSTFGSIVRDLPLQLRLQYGLHVAEVKSDNDSTISTTVKTSLHHEGVHHNASAPHTPEQNGPSERSGGVVITKARAMSIGAAFPEEMWPEVVSAAAYIHNRSPTESLQWATPLDRMSEWLDKNPDPERAFKPVRSTIDNLVAYGCKAYYLTAETLREKDKSIKLAPRAAVGYLCGYEARNIWRIWDPWEDCIVLTRDVIFDERSFYDPKDRASRVTVPEDIGTKILQWVNVAQPEADDVEALILALPPVTSGGMQSRQGAPSSQSVEKATIPGKAILARTPPASPGHSGGQSPQPQALELSDSSDQGVWTPESIEPDVPASQPPSASEPQQGNQPITTAPAHQAPPGQSTGITAVTRSGRQTVPSAALRQAQETEQIYGRRRRPRPNPEDTANFAFLSAAYTKIHRKDLPPEPRHYGDLKSHPYGAQFHEAMKAQWDAVVAKRVVQGLPAQEATGRILPLTWIYKYKFDKHGYLTKFKARICVRGDLQPTNELATYAATLAARAFRLLMAIAAYFDLDAFQLDAVDAFLNTDLDETVYIQYPDGFKIPGQCLRLLKGLYGLRRSPLLWYKELSSALKEMGLRPILEEPCIFANDWLVVFFFVDDSYS